MDYASLTSMPDDFVVMQSLIVINDAYLKQSGVIDAFLQGELPVAIVVGPSGFQMLTTVPESRVEEDTAWWEEKVRQLRTLLLRKNAQWN